MELLKLSNEHAPPQATQISVATKQLLLPHRET